MTQLPNAAAGLKVKKRKGRGGRLSTEQDSMGFGTERERTFDLASGDRQPAVHVCAAVDRQRALLQRPVRRGQTARPRSG